MSISKASSVVGVSEHRDKGRPARSQAEQDLAEEMKRGVSHINKEQTRRKEQSRSCRQVSGDIKRKLGRARYQMNPTGSEQRCREPGQHRLRERREHKTWRLPSVLEAPSMY